MEISISGQTAAAAQATRDDPVKIRNAARDFEALLLTQMLQAMREDGNGWLGTGEDQAGAQAMALAEEQFARALAASGGLGLTHLVTRGLEASPAATGSNYSSHTPTPAGPLPREK